MMAAKYWTCRKCGTRNERVKQKCAGKVVKSAARAAQRLQGSPLDAPYELAACDGRRPPKHVPKHAVTLRDHGYDHYRAVNEAIHGAGDNCGVCGTPPKDTRNLQREHDHVTGQPRGLACWRCNRLMPKQFGLVEALAIVAYLERVQAHYSQEPA